MPDKNTVIDFINRIKSDPSPANIRNLYGENLEAAGVAIDLHTLMNKHKIDEEEAERVLAARDGVAASRFMRKVLFGK